MILFSLILDMVQGITSVHSLVVKGMIFLFLLPFVLLIASVDIFFKMLKRLLVVFLN